MKIGMRLSLGFALTVILLIVLSVIVLLELSSIKTNVVELNERILKSKQANEIIDLANDNMQAITGLILLDKSNQGELQKRIEKNRNGISDRIKTLEGTIKSTEGKAKLKDLIDNRNNYVAKQELIMKNLNSSIDTLRFLLQNELEPSRVKYINSIHSLIEFQDNLVNKGNAEVIDSVAIANLWTLILAIIAIVVSAITAFVVTRSITKPLEQSIGAADKVSSGNVEVKLSTGKQDETGVLMTAMQKMADTVKELVAEVNELSQAAIAGKLDRRADSSKFGGEFAALIDGVNGTIDAIVKPLNVTAEYVDRISKGDIPSKITEEYKGDFNEIKNNLNNLIDTFTNLVDETGVVISAAKEGKLDVRASDAHLQGVYRKIIRGFNESLDAIISPLNVTAEYVDRISKGDMPPIITEEYKGDFNEIKNNLNQLINNVTIILKGISRVVVNIKNGKLDDRGNADLFQGDWKALVMEINDVIDSLIQPLNMSAEYIDRISKGDMPSLITEEYKGDFNEIKNNINLLIESTQNVTDAIVQIAKGNLEIEINQRSDKDILVKSVHILVENLFLLISETTSMYNAQKVGDMDAFISEGSFDGVYKQMAAGINDSVKLYVNILNKIFKVLGAYANGDLSHELEKLPGKQAVANENLDILKSSLHSILAEVNIIINAALEGQFEVRGDAGKLKGAFSEIVSGLNKSLDAFLYPIKETINVMQAMAEGDLTTRMKGDYKGDALTLKNAVNESLENTNEVLSQVRNTVEEVNRGAVQVSDASTALSQGATEQAASLEEITSSMTQIGSQTKLNAENANQANILTVDARDAAERGNNEMQQLNQAMTEITESSKNISKIIKVIDEIAFQTNLLALNAAVEAARAGRHGKGFAVVAEEVRNLAARSATAAKETSEMIENSIKTVEKGSLLATKTSEALEGIRNGSIKAADIVAEIATSSNEQAQGIAQINEGLQQIDRVTQTNTASAEESASAAEELSSQANDLRQMVARFKLKSSERGYQRSHDDDFDSPMMMSASRGSGKALPDYKKAPRAKAEDIIKLDEDDFGRY
jgi:methyl-accepting chemotaxis protein